MKEFEDMLSNIALIGILLLTLVLLVRLGYAWRTRESRQWLTHSHWKIIVFHIVAAIGLVSLGFGIFVYFFVLQFGNVFMPSMLKWVLIGLLFTAVTLEVALHFWSRPSMSIFAKIRGGVGILFCWGFAALLVVAFVDSSRYPSVAQSVLLDVPFDGEWVATGAGATNRTNHHNRIPSQRYAIDFAKACDDGRLFRGEGIAMNESCTWEAVIRAPASGTVVYAVDGLADGASREQLAGNHIVIRISEGRYVALAHLRQGSVLVAPGDIVAVGQVIAKAGNSGNSDFPHLHIHVQDGPMYDLNDSVSIPFQFKNVEVKRYLFWRSKNHVALLGNDWIRRHSSMEITSE